MEGLHVKLLAVFYKRDREVSNILCSLNSKRSLRRKKKKKETGKPVPSYIKNSEEQLSYPCSNSRSFPVLESESFSTHQKLILPTPCLAHPE